MSGETRNRDQMSAVPCRASRLFILIKSLNVVISSSAAAFIVGSLYLLNL